MRTPRHSLAADPFNADTRAHPLCQDAERYEESGNWYLAGERYVELAALVAGGDPELRARVLVRAAMCFEAAVQPRAAGAAYAEAGGSLLYARLRTDQAGQLYTRAATAYEAVGDYFSAGSHWKAAAEALIVAPELHCDPAENLPPVRGSGFTAAGTCLMAAGIAFEKSGEHALMSCGAYWQAGRAFGQHYRGYHSYQAYRAALRACIRYYGTLDIERLRSILPLTKDERTAGLNPVEVMVADRLEGNRAHYLNNLKVYPARWAEAETNREVAAAFREFHLELVRVGNAKEAGFYRAQEKECQRRVFVCERHYGSAFVYGTWWLLANYGESLRRWAVSTVVVLVAFAVAYWRLECVNNALAPFDYLYFSVVTFSSLGYGDLQPAGGVGKALACAEIVIGLIMFGLLLTFISNRVTRE